MDPINYPFYSDAVTYFGTLAVAFNQPMLLGKLGAIWSTQGPPGLKDPANDAMIASNGALYQTVQLCLLQVIGFSYQHALWIQAFLCALLIVLVAGCLYRQLDRQLDGKSQAPFPATLYCLVLIAFLSISGIFSLMPGNLYDYRLDLIGPLLLSLALAAIPYRNWGTAAAFAVAINERFHNLSVLVAVLAVWSVWRLWIRRESFRIIWPTLRFPVLGIGLVLLLRAPMMLMMAGFYSAGHFGREASQRGFQWGGTDFFLFYPLTFLNYFLHRKLFFLSLVIPAASWGLRWFSKQGPVPAKCEAERFLWLGAALAFLLLSVDPTRNNRGVLRFALIPAIFAFSLAYFRALLSLARSLAAAFGRPIMAARTLGLALALLAALGTRQELLRLLDFRNQFDERGFRSRHLVSQLDQVFSTIYRRAESSGRGAPIRAAANFLGDYNLNYWDWNIYLATHRLPEIPYRLVTGWGFYLTDIKNEMLLLKSGEYLVLGTDGCGDSNIPLTRQLRERHFEIENFAGANCQEVLGSVHLKDCDMIIRACRG